MTELSPIQDKKEKKREQIRTAAKHLFLQNGFQATSTDAIMIAAGIASKETLYRYYSTKEDLFVDVLRSLTVDSPSLHRMMEQPPSPNNIQELRILLQTIIQELLTTMLQPEYLGVIRMMIAELPRLPKLGTLFRQTVPEQAMSFLLTLLHNGQKNGVVAPNKDLEIIGRMLIGTLLTYAIFDGLLQNNQDPKMPSKNSVETIVENIMELVAVNKDE